MIIYIDTDGTKTDFSKFIQSYEKYFKKKYSFYIINPKAIELEDVYDIENTLISRGMSEMDAKTETKIILNKFWVSPRFIKFSLLSRFRPLVAHQINSLKKQGHIIKIVSSRDKTTENNIIGTIARTFTKLQYKFNNVNLPKQNINFFKNDAEKLEFLKKSKIDLLFDDKPDLIKEASKFTKIICVNNNYNLDTEFSDNVARINYFSDSEVSTAFKKLFGEKKFDYLTREAKANKFFKLLKKLAVPLLLKKFNPIILNEEKLVNNNDAIVFASNHRSTLDPLVINAYLKTYVHWIALKRFFTGEDSIFNNSKHPILCKLTSMTFKKLEFFPIERTKDNKETNNLIAMKDVNGFLKINSKVGIFPEGTTLKDTSYSFGKFDNAFLKFTKKYNAWVQPITLLWIKELNIKEKLIINFGDAFKLDNMTIEEAYSCFLASQYKCMNENIELRSNLTCKKIKYN